jgi:hypothetical protein
LPAAIGAAKVTSRSYPSRPDQWWVADVTSVWTTAGFCYVSFVTDVYSRRILGWRVSTSKTTPLVTCALQQALFTRRRTNATSTATGLLHHSEAPAQPSSIHSSESGELGGHEVHAVPVRMPSMTFAHPPAPLVGVRRGSDRGGGGQVR